MAEDASSLVDDKLLVPLQERLKRMSIEASASASSAPPSSSSASENDDDDDTGDVSDDQHHHDHDDDHDALYGPADHSLVTSSSSSSSSSSAVPIPLPTSSGGKLMLNAQHKGVQIKLFNVVLNNVATVKLGQ